MPADTLLLVVIAILVAMLIGLRRIIVMERSILNLERKLLKKRK